VAKKYHQGRAAVFVGTDITERNQSQALLRESRELFLRFMNNSPSVAFMKDEDGHMLYVNSLFETIFSGLGNVLGKTDHDLFPAEFADRFRDIDLEVLNTGRQVEIIEHVPQQDGVHQYLSNKFSFRDEKGRNVLGCVSTDITARMRIEADLAQKISELARHDNKLARLGLLVSGVAHEINNPANFISLSTPLLRDAWDGIVPILDEYRRNNGEFTLLNMDYSQVQPYIRDLFHSIDSGVQRIKRIVQELTAFSRKDVPEQSDELDIRLVVKAAIALLKHQIRKSTDRFSETYDADLPPVTGSFQRLEQVCVNLVQNACQALSSKDRGISVEVRHDEDNDSVVITVADEGIGIATDLLPRITEPFYTTKHDHGGTGLGLSIAAKIVEEHRGAISFSSQVGVGTCVTIVLPCRAAASADEAVATSIAASGT
jgi:PAS domain S-box-containing protein